MIHQPKTSEQEKTDAVAAIRQSADALNAAMAQAAKLGITTEVTLLDGTSMNDRVRWTLLDVAILERLG